MTTHKLWLKELLGSMLPEFEKRATYRMYDNFTVTRNVLAILEVLSEYGFMCQIELAKGNRWRCHIVRGPNEWPEPCESRIDMGHAVCLAAKKVIEFLDDGEI